jgi:hypothetical protein
MGLKDFSQDCQVAKYMLKDKMASLSAVYFFITRTLRRRYYV